MPKPNEEFKSTLKITQIIVEVQGKHYVVGITPEMQQVLPSFIEATSPDQRIQLAPIESLGMRMVSAQDLVKAPQNED